MDLEQKKIELENRKDLYKHYIEQRNRLDEKAFKLISYLNRTLIVLSSGAIVLSISFVGYGICKGQAFHLIFYSWVSFAICITLCLGAAYLDFIMLAFYTIPEHDNSMRSQMQGAQYQPTRRDR